MKRLDILYFYGMVSIRCIALIIFFYIVVRKQKVSEYLKKGILNIWLVKEKNQYYFDAIFRMSLLFFTVYYFIISIPYFKDLTYVRKGYYREVTGIAKCQEHRRNNTVMKRYITVIDRESEQNISVIIMDKYIDKGELLTVRYLPNTGFGSRIKEE